MQRSLQRYAVLLLLACAGVPALGSNLGVCTPDGTLGVRCGERAHSPTLQSKEARHPLPVLTHERGDKCVDATSYPRLYDLSCVHRARRAYYHRTRDCLVPGFEVVELAKQDSAATAAVLVPTYMAAFAEFFLPGMRWLKLPWKVDNATCVSVAPAATVFYNAGTTTRKQLQSSSKRLRALTRNGTASRARSVPSTTLVFIQRAERFGRNFRDAEQLKARLGAALQLDVVTYHGNESLAETVRLFAAARAVFGFHGAGFVNVFCQAPTVVIEVTLLADETSSALWRSNENGLTAIAPDTKWVVHALSTRHVVMPTVEDLRRFREPKRDADHVLKYTSNVVIPDVELDDILARAKELLQAQQRPRPARG